MIFGQKVAATISRTDPNTSVQNVIFPSTNHPTFTVRRLLGTIFQTLRYETELTQPFGMDPNQLRMVFADWPVGLVDDFPIVPSDILTVGTYTYEVVGTKFFPLSHMEIYVRVGIASTNTS